MVADTSPAYMQLDDSIIKAALGAEIGGRIFSDEFSEFRAGALMQTIPDAPEIGMVMLDIYPHKLETGELAWIEKYMVKGEHEFGRSIMMLLAENSLQFAHLVPGQSKASPLLQCDVLDSVLALIKNDGAGAGADWSDLERNETLARRGIPEVWPKGCPAALFDSVVTRAPEDGGGDWSERWGFHIGDDVVLVDIEFSAAPDGGTLISPKIFAG